MPGKILVIDDEFLILNTVERALAKVGYHVTSARDMQELVTALKNAPFDLVITDLHMEDESVENIIARVKQTSPSVRVLVMSGSSSKVPVANFIEKPFKLDELREKVRTLLHESS